MQAPAAPAAAAAAIAAADRSQDRHVARSAGALADILGAAEIGEDELLLRLRELGLVTYPSPLLEGLLEDLPEVLAAEVPARLPPRISSSSDTWCARAARRILHFSSLVTAECAACRFVPARRPVLFLARVAAIPGVLALRADFEVLQLCHNLTPVVLAILISLQ